MMQDEKIVELYWQKDESAIKETQQKCERYLYKIAYNILADREDSKESVNDTYLSAWNSIPPHKPVTLSELEECVSVGDATAEAVDERCWARN